MPNKNKVAHVGESSQNNLSKYSNGPIDKRSCTDFLCLLIFLIFIGGMIGITSYALSNGNPQLVGRGYDSDGKICGYDEGYEDFPLLYWPVPQSADISRTVCVAACPENPLPNELNCKTNTVFSTCQGINDPQDILDSITNNLTNSQSFFIYDTIDVAGRICLPAQGLIFATQISDEFLNSDTIAQWVSDVRTTWPIIIASVAIAVAIGVVYMIFMRLCTGVLVWGAILFAIIVPAILGWQYYEKAKDTKELINSAQTDQVEDLKHTERTEKAIAYLCWAITAITFLAVLCLYSRIRIAVGVLKAAADYVRDTLSVLLVPVAFLAILVLLYVYWTITAVYLVSSGEPSQLNDTPVGTFKFDSELQKLLIYHLFALLWCNAFINAASLFVIASSVCIWYFSQGTGQGSSGTIRRSVYRLVRYHLGSIAFGSLILAIVQFIRIVLAYIEKKAKQWAGKEGKLMKFVLGCLNCYVGCFERFIKFLNKNAYIQIALTGKSFCFAAKDGFFLVLKNPIRFGVLYGVGTVFIFFGKCFIAAASALIGFVIITKADTYESKIYSPFIPTLLMFLFSYTVASLFLNVYGMAADTILACFVLDEELQKKRNAPPLHCPSALKSLLDRHRQN